MWEGTNTIALIVTVLILGVHIAALFGVNRL